MRIVGRTIGCAVALAATSALADQTPRTGVIDQAGVVAPEDAAQINGWLLELEKQTGAQLKVWTMESSNGRDLYELAEETAKLWQLGQKGHDNGCLVAIATKDRKWRIVTGEGVEGVLPDLYCDEIAKKYFLPYFRKNNHSEGIKLGTIALAQSLAKEAGVELTGVPRIKLPRRSGGAATALPFAVLSLVGFIIFLSMARSAARYRQSHRGGWGPGPWGWIMLGHMLGNMSSGRSTWSGGSSWSGFSSGGGGFGGGGFGGGGGGSFGGGGAGGSW